MRKFHILALFTTDPGPRLSQSTKLQFQVYAAIFRCKRFWCWIPLHCFKVYTLQIFFFGPITSLQQFHWRRLCIDPFLWHHTNRAIWLVGSTITTCKWIVLRYPSYQSYASVSRHSASLVHTVFAWEFHSWQHLFPKGAMPEALSVTLDLNLNLNTSLVTAWFLIHESASPLGPHLPHIVLLQVFWWFKLPVWFKNGCSHCLHPKHYEFWIENQVPSSIHLNPSQKCSLNLAFNSIFLVFSWINIWIGTNIFKRFHPKYHR